MKRQHIVVFLAAAILGLAGCAAGPIGPAAGVHRTPHRMGAEIGSYALATTPLSGNERMIGDQNGGTVNITPSQIRSWLTGLNLLLPGTSAPNGSLLIGNGSSFSTATLTAGSNITITNGPGTITIASTGGGGGSNAFQVNGTNVTNPATINFENSGATNGLTFTFTNPSAGNVQLGLTGTLSVAGGGTGLGNITQYDLMAGNGGGNVSTIAPSATVGQALISNGSAAFPSFSASLSGVTSVNGSSVPASAGALAGTTGTFTVGDCAKIGATSPVEVADAGSPCGSGSGAVSSVTAGPSGDLSVSPTTGAVVADLASQAAYTVCANTTSSAAVPGCNSTMANIMAAIVATQAKTYTPTLASGATNDWDPSGGSGITSVGVAMATPASAGSIVDGIVAGSDKDQFLLCNTAPAHPPTQSAPSTATTGGTLTAGTYYYVITATSASGETLRGNEQNITTTGTTSTVTLTWALVPGATGYRVYRGTAAAGENTYYTVSSGSTLTYTDTGAAGTASSPPATYNSWIELQAQSTADSTAANRLTMPGNQVLMGQACALLTYVAGSVNSWMVNVPSNAGPSLDMLASGTSMTPDVSFDVSSETASAAGALTINLPNNGTPTPWKRIILAITNYSGSANTYSWASGYHASSSAALPAGGTAAGAKDLFAVFWDPLKLVYDVGAINQGF